MLKVNIKRQACVTLLLHLYCSGLLHHKEASRVLYMSRNNESKHYFIAFLPGQGAETRSHGRNQAKYG